ncbi:Predicted secreted hydrolase [Modicisalibacter ilicicola DSM 19980]|uniref:Predicted secreted hydrolase n=1 Tax=Modicisalibacter ilicicola DSM 19980 TaxID=1121942 RepID=A0A1M5EK46_9GAMM|nr:lipocalin-like domain-containing protein [Halomonas ilicicola]SHF79500.1 Predicted secreted hydrolase [Halomonas ilicicola DSM 19980]
MTRILLLLTLIAALLLGWQFWPDERPTSTSYAGLGEDTADFRQARPGTTLAFPADHGPHPDYRIEWWYLTANLVDEDGRAFGVQWTLFRQAMAPADPALETPSPWTSRQLWMAHAALSTLGDHRFSERFARGGVGQAGVEAAPFAAWIDDWSLRATDATAGLDRLVVQASDETFGYRLNLDAEGPLVRHGDAGFSQKSADGQGSMYYSQPFYRVTGQLRLDGEVIAVGGRAWLDREWSSQLLGPTQSGWDWFSLHLDGGAKLMAFRLRGGSDEKGDGGDYLSGSWITPQGEVTPLVGDELRLTPLDDSRVAGRELPTTWRVEVPGHGLDVTVRARHPDQWMDTSFAYWEGMVSVEGSQEGVGYLEMTGYAPE